MAIVQTSSAAQTAASAAAVRPKHAKRRWGGWLTVEKLGTIAGYAMMVAMVVIVIQQIYDRIKGARSGTQIDNIVTAVRNFYAGQAGYPGLDNSALRSNNMIAPDLIDPASATGILGVFGPITVAVDPADNNQFTLQLAGINAANCSRLVRERQGGAQFAGIIAVSINGGADITAFPLTPAQSAGCNITTAAGNTVRWTYR